LLLIIINTIHYIQSRNGCWDDFSYYVYYDFHKSGSNTWHLVTKSQHCSHPIHNLQLTNEDCLSHCSFLVSYPIPMLCSTKAWETIIMKSKPERMGELGVAVICQNSSAKDRENKKKYTVWISTTTTKNISICSKLYYWLLHLWFNRYIKYSLPH
jgi:hypothetical protein